MIYNIHNALSGYVIENHIKIQVEFSVTYPDSAL
jgi:hypothetical protein